MISSTQSELNKCGTQKEINHGSIPSLCKSSEKYQCGHCRKYLTSRVSLNKHLRYHWNNKQGLITNEHLKSYMKTNRKDTYCVCNVCGYKCEGRNALSIHKRIHMSIQPYVCDICGYMCSEISTMYRHKTRHTAEKPYSCDVCGYKCAVNGNLKLHKQIHGIHSI